MVGQGAARVRQVPASHGMWVLGLECGGDHLGVALVAWRGPGDFEIREDLLSFRGHRHADAVLLRVHEMLQQQGIGPADPGLVAVGRGPGGFTGIRVGLATALGLSLATGVPVWPVCSLTSLAVEAGLAAHGGPDAGPIRVAALIDARRAEVYGAVFDVAQDGTAVPVIEPAVLPLAAFETAMQALEPPVSVHAGSAVATARRALAPRLHIGSAVRHACLAAAAFDAVGRDATRVPALDAAYLRKSEAELNAEKALGKRAPIGD